MSTLLDNYSAVLARMAAAAQSARRDPAEIVLLPVSKTFGADMIRELYDHGVHRFGENRVPELEEKQHLLPDDIEWHFIGHIQSNKARRVVRCAAVIQSVDSLELLRKLDRVAGEERKHPKILIEVNVSGEASKDGVGLGELFPLAQAAAICENLDFCGLMTMAPCDADEMRLAAIFERLAMARDDLSRSLNRRLPLLSMGMSGDFEVAIRHGATMVRIGTDIFGIR